MASTDVIVLGPAGANDAGVPAAVGAPRAPTGNGRHIDAAAPDGAEQVLALTGGRGADVLLYLSRTTASVHEATLLAPLGRVVHADAASAAADIAVTAWCALVERLGRTP